MDLLIKNAHIITGIPGKMYAGIGNIGVSNDKITYIGTMEPKATKTIEASGMIALPGLFNAHAHSSMVLMRNYIADKCLEDWLTKSIFPIEEKLTAEYVRHASILAAAEMIRSGTVGFLDMYYHVEETAKIVMDIGMKANISLGILTAGGDENDSQKAREKSLAFHREYAGSGDGRLRTSLEVHSVYLYEEEGLRQSADFAASHEIMVHAHLHETKSEVHNSIEKYGRRPIEVFDGCGLLDVPVTAAHCVHMNDSDLSMLKEKGVRPVHCPSSNMFLGSGFARVPEMLKMGIPVALGTDGAASNNNLDMFGEINLAGLIHKGHSGDATVMNSESVIRMAATYGAAAMGFENTGTVTEGGFADIILVDADTIHNTPLLNPVNALVYSTNGADVDTVIVNGRILMEKKELKTIDEEKARFEVNRCIGQLY